MDRLGRLRAVLAAHRPVGERELASVNAARALLDELSEPFSEHADPRHVTASAIVVSERGVLLHRHKRLGIWLQPGGHVESDETVEDAAIREAHEETGLAVRHPSDGPRLIHVDVHPGPRGHTHLDIRYLLWAPPDDPVPLAGESPEARWFDWDEAAALADAALLGALAAARGFVDAHDGAGDQIAGGSRRLKFS